jgi:nicotinate-nucleotide pyrophosphorylase
MTITKVKDLLEQLQQELKKTQPEVDAETKKQLENLDASIHDILNVDNVQPQDIYDGIQAMEYGFLTKHPVASGIIREAIDILSKAGI